MMRHSPRRLLLRMSALLLLTVPLGLGCGAGKGTVTGKVYYKGAKSSTPEPLKGGRVSLAPERGPPVMVEIQEDGGFTANEVPAGPVKVTVDTEYLNPKVLGKIPKYTPPKGQTGPNQGNQPDLATLTRKYRKLPADYSDPAKTPLSYTVTKGQQTKDFTIEGP